MKRGRFILSAFAMYPISAFGKMVNNIPVRNVKGFNVSSGDSRNHKSFRMKGITSNVLDFHSDK